MCNTIDLNNNSIMNGLLEFKKQPKIWTVISRMIDGGLISQYQNVAEFDKVLQEIVKTNSNYLFGHTIADLLIEWEANFYITEHCENQEVL